MFGVAALSSDKVSRFLAELVIKQAETEVEDRIEPDPRMKVPMPDFFSPKVVFGPDLSRKVNLFHTISYFFIICNNIYHTFS